MKKLVFAVMATLAMMSCSKDETTSVKTDGEISFRTSVGMITRANQTTLANLSTFQVTAIGEGANGILFKGLKVDKTGEDWNTSYFWPTHGLRFFAYAPQTPGGIVKMEKESQKIENFQPATAVTDQKDLVVTYNTGTKAVNGASGVPLNFKHALSQIEVKAKCMNTNIRIEVLGVKICNIPSTSTFTFPTAETNSAYELSQTQWSTPSTEVSYIVRGTSESKVTLTGEPQSIMFGDNNFMLIPQHLTAWDGTASTAGAYLSVLCRISSVNGEHVTQLYPPAPDKYGFSAVPINTDWLPGKKYTYTLEYCGTGGGGGEIDPNPTDPTNPTDPEIDPNPGTGGEEILGEMIKFTVTVDEWTEVATPVTM